MALQLKDLAALDEAPSEAVGQPMSVAVGLIDEDPGQPRTEFDPESLQELALTIADRGVCQPVSVRAHPDAPGRFMLNFGARRLRAARLAGKDEIPAFVADLGDGYAQVIENEQREALKPMELALFVQRRIGAGESLAEIARRLGKTRGYLTFVTALIDAPSGAPPPISSTMTRSGVPIGTSISPVFRIFPASANTFVPLLFSVPMVL